MHVSLESDSLRVIQTIASTRADHGGTSRSVPALCDHLADIGVDNHLVTFRPFDRSVNCLYPKLTAYVHLLDESRYYRQIGIGKSLRRKIESLIVDREKTLVHDHAIWLPSNSHIARICRDRNVARVVSPRGMLGKWALSHGHWKKRLAWLLFQKRDLATADAFHATSEQERKEILSHGFTQPTIVVPNGIEIPDILPTRQTPSENRVALFLSRIHPKKGLVNLLHAWKRANVSQDWKLVIAGPDECGHKNELQGLISRLALGHSVSLGGEVLDTEKWQLYANADLFVLPSHNENFGIVIAEAMGAGLPVITTTGTPWSCLQEKNLGWWVAPAVDELENALRIATAMSRDALRIQGERSRMHVVESFTWEKTASALAEFYRATLRKKIA
jgi:glycosyltransferase involved in cell wall biosynthesis